MTSRHLLPLLWSCLLLLPAAGREELGPAIGGADDVAASGSQGLSLVTAEPAETGGTGQLGTRWPALGAGIRLVPTQGEFRGAWLHWEDYLTPEAIARTVARARRARLNALLALANYPDQAMWRSRTIPTNPRVAPGFDPLRELVRQAHAAGLQVHPYLVMLNAGLTKHPGIKPDWYARTATGQRYGGWLNPSHPEVRDFLAALVAEVAETGVDGIHYDYIRHEYDSDYGYDEYSRQKFFNQYGWDPLELRGAAGGAGVRLLKTSFHNGDGAGLFADQQRFVAAAGFRPPVMPEANLPQLRSDTVLVAGNLYSSKVSGATVENLLDFVARGGAAIILDGPEITTISRKLAAAVGLAGKGYLEERPTTITMLRGPAQINAGVDRQIQTRVRGNPSPLLGDATLLALLDDGTPALTTRSYGKGTFVVFNFHIYTGEAADNPALQRLFTNVVDWLTTEHGIVNTTATVANGTRISPATWDRWRVEEVSSLVRYLTATARKVRPDIITSAAGGTQREDLQRVKRDGHTWLRRNDVQFLCPMAYTTDNTIFRRRLAEELDPVAEPELRQMLFAGIGVYKRPSAPQRWLEQIAIARQMGLKGVCLFAFENLTDDLIAALAAGPFAQPAPVPWTPVPVASGE